MVKHLLKQKADPQAVTLEGMTAVHIAAAYDRSILIPLLTSQFECGIDINAKVMQRLDVSVFSLGDVLLLSGCCRVGLHSDALCVSGVQYFHVAKSAGRKGFVLLKDGISYSIVEYRV